jgi:hypothetical protein
LIELGDWTLFGIAQEKPQWFLYVCNRAKKTKRNELKKGKEMI